MWKTKDVFIAKSGDLLTKLGVEKVKNLTLSRGRTIYFHDDYALAHATVRKTRSTRLCTENGLNLYTRFGDGQMSN